MEAPDAGSIGEVGTVCSAAGKMPDCICIGLTSRFALQNPAIQRIHKLQPMRTASLEQVVLPYVSSHPF